MYSYKILKTEQEYTQALNALNTVFHVEPWTPEGDHADMLSLLIEKYEEIHYPIEDPDPIEAIQYKMEQLGMSSKDLWKIVKYKSRATEILNRKRKLTLWMIRSISNALNISPKILIKDYPLAV